MSTRSRVSVVSVALAAAVVGAFAQGTPDRFVFELAPEAPDAQKQGAAEVDAAQKLAKSGQLVEAARKLEALARRLPASVHDCNLALAYLRASNVTAAKLAHDLSALRNGARPKWCTGEVSTQLSDALRVGRFVPTELDITPNDALVEVNGVALRKLRTVWLPATPQVFTVSAPGMVTQTVTQTIAAPSARLTLTLEPPKPVVADAGVVEPASTPDAAVAVTPPPAPDAGVATLPPPHQDDDALIKVDGAPVGYKAAALTVAIGGWVGAGVLGVLAYREKQDANAHYKTDPAFVDHKDQYDTFKYISLGCAIAGAVATGVYIYFVAAGDTTIKKPGKIEVGLGADGSVGVSYSGSFGGPR